MPSRLRGAAAGLALLLGACSLPAHARTGSEQPVSAHRIAFVHGQLGLVTAGSDGGDVRPVRLSGPSLPPGSGAKAAAYSPDGRRLAFLRAGSEELWLANADGSGARRLLAKSPDSEGWLSDIAWSPRGDLLYLGLVAKPTGRALQLWQLGTGGTDPRPVFDRPAGAASWDHAPAVSRTGLLAFNRGDRVFGYDPGAGGAPRDLGITGYGPTFSPEGDRVAVSRDGEIVVYPVGGGPGTALTAGEHSAQFPAWSPDGAAIAYTTETGSTVAVHSATVAGGRGLRLTESGRVRSTEATWVPSVR